MANSISDLASLQRSEFPIQRTERKGAREAIEGDDSRVASPDFADAFAEAIATASDDEAVATDMATRFADGDPEVGIHEVVIASERANVSLRYTVTMKNKLIEAYREIMNTQV